MRYLGKTCAWHLCPLLDPHGLLRTGTQLQRPCGRGSDSPAPAGSTPTHARSLTSLLLALRLSHVTLQNTQHVSVRAYTASHVPRRSQLPRLLQRSPGASAPLIPAPGLRRAAVSLCGHRGRSEHVRNVGGTGQPLCAEAVLPWKVARGKRGLRSVSGWGSRGTETCDRLWTLSWWSGLPQRVCAWYLLLRDISHFYVLKSVDSSTTYVVSISPSSGLTVVPSAERKCSPSTVRPVHRFGIGVADSVSERACGSSVVTGCRICWPLSLWLGGCALRALSFPPELGTKSSWWIGQCAFHPCLAGWRVWWDTWPPWAPRNASFPGGGPSGVSFPEGVCGTSRPTEVWPVLTASPTDLAADRSWVLVQAPRPAEAGPRGARCPGCEGRN